MTELIESWRLEVHDRFYKKLASLPKGERERILAALVKMQHNPFEMNLKPLRGRTDWRLRVGGWRILLRVDLSAKVMIAYELGARGDVYK